MYHWIRGLANESVSIYTFRPHGSKNITDLHFLTPEDLGIIFPEIVCHDQEPLNYEIHQSVDILQLWLQARTGREILPGQQRIMNEIIPKYQNLNFYSMLRALKFRTIFDRYILLHSELNSQDVEKFQHCAEPVYYWSHGIIARDWYRFAEHDRRLLQPASSKKTFLLYCRAWTGTREYRLKFLDLLAGQNILDDCQVSVLHQDQGVDLIDYVCRDSKFQPVHLAQLSNIPNNEQPACASADYSVDDILSTDISVVLETVAADSKIHLTEKTLRPIACGHPFMLMAGPEALQCLRAYGFKTFSPWIDESYDFEKDPIKRMEMIIVEMSKISALPLLQKQNLLTQLREVAQYNKTHFFSEDFFNRVRAELTENLNSAIDRVKHTRGQQYLAMIPLIKKYKKYELPTKTRNLAIAKTLRQLRKNPNTSIRDIVSQFSPGFFNA